MSGVPRILAFAGSTRKNSLNNRLVRLAEVGARQAGALVTHVDLRDYRLPLFDADDETASGKPASAKALKQLMVEHQGLLIASPEYNSSITAVLKNTVDWVSRPDGGDESPLVAFRGKVVGLISASPGALGGLRGLVHIRSILGNLGCLVLPGQVTIPRVLQAFGENGTLLDERKNKEIVDLGSILAETTAKLL